MAQWKWSICDPRKMGDIYWLAGIVDGVQATNNRARMILMKGYANG